MSLYIWASIIIFSFENIKNVHIILNDKKRKQRKYSINCEDLHIHSTHIKYIKLSGHHKKLITNVNIL